MSLIHTTAVISPDATLGRNVFIGPFVVIESDVCIGDECRIESHSVIKSGTKIGFGNWLGEHAIIGGLPQHANCPTSIGTVSIGNKNTFREHVTVHRAMHHQAFTGIGSNNLLMVNTHVGHDCSIGDHTIIANNVMLAGHVSVASRAYISGAVGIHQFCRVGSLAMVGGQAHITKDIPPFVTIDGLSSRMVGLNLIGMRRAGLDATTIKQIKAAYRIVFREGLPWMDAIAQLKRSYPSGPVMEFAEFLESTQRGCISPRNRSDHTILRLYRDDEATSTDASTRAA